MLIAKDLVEATFLERPNRFLGIVKLDNNEIQCFIPNPGRMKELLIKDQKVFLVKRDSSNRKTDYDMIAVKYGERIVSIDSRVPNKLSFQLFKNKVLLNETFDVIRPEFNWGNSRFDFLLKKDKTKYLIEVKSCTLVKNNIALFPDAPTERGARHVYELTKALDQGYNSMILFIVQRADAELFKPNKETDKKFSENLKIAHEKGVMIKILTNKISLKENNLYIDPMKEIGFDIT